MNTSVLIPVIRVKCRVKVDQGRAWTPVEELILWAISRRSHSIADLVSETLLPHQVVVAAISRLARFRFAKVTVRDGLNKFVASTSGARAVSSGDPLPFFPKPSEMWIGIAIERVGGRILSGREIVRVTPFDFENLQNCSFSERPVVLDITGGVLDAGSDAMMSRIGHFVARGREQKLVGIDSGTFAMWNEHIAVTVENGLVRNLPEVAGDKLREIVKSAAAARGRTTVYKVPFLNPDDLDEAPSSVACSFSPDDIVVGGSAQRTLFEGLLKKAASRVIIHSTFISMQHVGQLLPAMREACSRDVVIDVLWGAAKGDEKERYGQTANDLARLARSDPALVGRLRVYSRSTGSHAKLMLLDTNDGDWIATVSSCNWLKSPFQSVELTTVLRHPRLVARVAASVQKMSGERGLADSLASEMSILVRDLNNLRGTSGSAMVDVIAGDEHDVLMRTACGETRDRFIIGMHKLGATARPGALLPAQTASAASKTVMVLYTLPSGPLKNRHARELEREAQEHNVMLMRMKDIPLHGKFLIWDRDNVVISSINWGSASTNEDFPLGDIGVHVRAPGIGESVFEKLAAIFPRMKDEVPIQDGSR
jgi:cardiolipin synthase